MALECGAECRDRGGEKVSWLRGLVKPAFYPAFDAGKSLTKRSDVSCQAVDFLTSTVSEV